MKMSELKDKQPVDWQRMLAEARQKLQDLRFSVATNQLKNVREIRRQRTLISRLMTLLNNRTKIDS